MNLVLKKNINKLTKLMKFCMINKNVHNMTNLAPLV